MGVGQIVPKATGGLAARRSARRVSTVLPVSPRPEPAGAAPATRAAAARTVSATLPDLSPRCDLWLPPLPLPFLPCSVPSRLVWAQLPHEVLLCQ